MIIVRRLTGQPFAVNPDLIERIECTPDTILVLMDGTRYIVDESMDEVVEMVRAHRAGIVAQALHPPQVHAVVPEPAGRADQGDHVIVHLPDRSRGE